LSQVWCSPKSGEPGKKLKRRGVIQGMKVCPDSVEPEETDTE